VRGVCKSLTDDVLMRWFVVDEEAARWRGEMEVVQRRQPAPPDDVGGGGVERQGAT
jgi:hypothetical protein